jgi:hypothetical protein
LKVNDFIGILHLKNNDISKVDIMNCQLVC